MVMVKIYFPIIYLTKLKMDIFLDGSSVYVFQALFWCLPHVGIQDIGKKMSWQNVLTQYASSDWISDSWLGCRSHKSMIRLPRLEQTDLDLQDL